VFAIVAHAPKKMASPHNPTPVAFNVRRGAGRVGRAGPGHDLPLAPFVGEAIAGLKIHRRTRVVVGSAAAR